MITYRNNLSLFSRPLDFYFTDEKILIFVARKRAALAKLRSEKHLFAKYSEAARKSYLKSLAIDRERNQLMKITPARRQWASVGKRRRYSGDQSKTSVERNTQAILLTVKRDRARAPGSEYLKELDAFIHEVKSAINGGQYRISSPRIRPELKDKDPVSGACTYRPICTYSLRDKAVISFVNSYLVDLVDPVFYRGSFAFRSKRNMDGGFRTPNHHDAFQSLIDFAGKSTNAPIFVAECDMKKFFDTVNHRVLLKCFRSLLRRLPSGTVCDPRAVRLVRSYLNSYDFPRHVEVLNGCDSFFSRHRMQTGSFPWLRDAIAKSYRFFPRHDVGIPQGGALSGFLANVVLSEVDWVIEAQIGDEALYVRYCDDMVLLSRSREQCERLLKLYEATLQRLHLFPHRPGTGQYGAEFWKLKTKSTYEWSATGVPWIGFVGYEINREGQIRARKRSIKKELEKQRGLVRTFRQMSKKVNDPVETRRMANSIIDRLVGMAVGKFEIWNSQVYRPSMCWTSGFRLLNDNKWTRAQAKALDRGRMESIGKIKGFVRQLPKDKDSVVENKRTKKAGGRKIEFYGKPFSYYYQLVERRSGSEFRIDTQSTGRDG